MPLKILDRHGFLFFGVHKEAFRDKEQAVCVLARHAIIVLDWALSRRSLPREGRAEK